VVLVADEDDIAKPKPVEARRAISARSPVMKSWST